MNLGFIGDLLFEALLSGVLGFMSTSLFNFFAEVRERLGKPLPLYMALIQYGGAFTLMLLGLRRLFSSTGFVPTLLKSAALGNPYARVFAVGVLLLIGKALFQLRENERRIYALLELAIATLTAYSSLEKFTGLDNVSAWMPMAGAVYLVVRGLDNLSQGNKAVDEAEKKAGDTVTAPFRPAGAQEESSRSSTPPEAPKEAQQEPLIASQDTGKAPSQGP